MTLRFRPNVTFVVTELRQQFVSPECAAHLPGLATLSSRVDCRPAISDSDWSLENVPKAGRPSRKREDHHPRAVAAGDQGAEGKQLPPGQRIGEAQLPQ